MQSPTTPVLCTLVTTQPGVNMSPLTSGMPTMTASEYNIIIIHAWVTNCTVMLVLHLV